MIGSVGDGPIHKRTLNALTLSNVTGMIAGFVVGIGDGVASFLVALGIFLIGARAAIWLTPSSRTIATLYHEEESR